MIFLLPFLLSLPLWSATSSDNLVQIITKCFPARDLKDQQTVEKSLREKLQRPDLRMKLISGYSNNEISNNNPERFQYGANIRWEDITDNSDRKKYQENMAVSSLEQTKLTLENYWRNKIEDFYYWKWGQSSVENASKLLIYSQKKIEAAEEQFQSLAITRAYSDLIELNSLASNFLGTMEALNRNISRCPQLKAWEEKLDFDQQEISFFSTKSSNRLIYQRKYCTAQKKLRTISMEREAGIWTVAFNSSVTRNRLLGNSSESFNDIRAGIEINIPISGAHSGEVLTDRCDYDEKLLVDEDIADRSTAQALYPILNSFQRQLKQIKSKINLMNTDSAGIQTKDAVQLGLNFFKLHDSLSKGEAKLNSRILPSKIVEHEF